MSRMREVRASAISQVEVDNWLANLGPLWTPPTYKPITVSATDIFAPRSFADYIGQAEAKELAQIMVKAAKIERRSLPNILIVGEYGLGKTSLARLLVAGVGEIERLVDGSSVNVDPPTTGTYIIDEIHNITSEVADMLNLHLDRGNLTIIGCTTDPGKLPAAFRSRFRQLYLENYTTDDLSMILQKVCFRKPVTAAKDALFEVAARSRNNARVAINTLAFIFDFMVVKNQHTITKTLVIDAAGKLGVDNNGFLKRDYKLLSAVPFDRPVGLQYLASVTGIDEKTIEEEVEPYLMRRGLVDRTPRGRIKLREIDEV